MISNMRQQMKRKPEKAMVDAVFRCCLDLNLHSRVRRLQGTEEEFDWTRCGEDPQGCCDVFKNWTDDPTMLCDAMVGCNEEVLRRWRPWSWVKREFVERGKKPTSLP